jgi:hypothetical protein
VGDLHFVKKGVPSFLVLLLRIVVALLLKTKPEIVLNCCHVSSGLAGISFAGTDTIIKLSLCS